MIFPEVGAKVPVSRLNSVVLPAPFGPMIECSEPASIESDTPLTAVSAPNDLVRFSVLKSIFSQKSRPQARPCLDHAAPEKQHHYYERHAEQQLPARPKRAHRFR